jgi:glycine/D-amino acid oxidase-like deaminating enzyme
MTERRFDAMVVGGGLVGSAIAWGLRREGLSVALLDEGDVAYRASRGNFGLVWVQSRAGRAFLSALDAPVSGKLG